MCRNFSINRLSRVLCVFLSLCLLLIGFTSKRADAADISVVRQNVGSQYITLNSTWRDMLNYSVTEQQRIVTLCSCRTTYYGDGPRTYYENWCYYANYTSVPGANLFYRILADEQVILQGTSVGVYNSWNNETSFSIPSFNLAIKGVKNIKVQFSTDYATSFTLSHESNTANYTQYNQIEMEYTDRLTAKLLETPLELVEVKLAAQNAQTAANNANTSASNANTAANAASSRTWDSAEGKSAATLAKEARDRAQSALTEIGNVKSKVDGVENKINNIGTEVGNVQVKVDDIKNQIDSVNSKINDIDSVVTNIQNLNTPFIQNISGYNGATCTKTNTFDVIVQANNATEFRARVESGVWSDWVSMGNYATVTGLGSQGAYTIFVEVRNDLGAISTGQKMVFRL